ncbi:extracellular solute-binding protein [Ruminococcaceae bacterium OttesenSCG-928-A16]|nr:extracellular solute-binding protein [Ruminococcaceae bacterium OttesenSCG-928-A16]
MKKTIAILLAVCCVGLMLASCGSTPASSPAPASAAGEAPTVPTEEVTLQFWHHYSAQSAENETLMNILIPKFEQENPGIKVNAVSHEWADLHDKLLISAQSNTLPDVARLDSAWIPEFQQMDILVALNQEMSDFDSVAGNLLESAMSTAKIGDDFFGLALNTNTKILYYNTKALADAGIAPPATMDDFVAAAKTLAGTNGDGQQVWGYNEPGLSGWNLCPFIWSCGGELTNPEQTIATGYINSEATVGAIQMLADLYQSDSITGWNSGDIPMTDGFGTGRYLMMLEGPWKTAELAGAYPDLEYGTAPMPAGAGGSHSVLGGEDISMFTSANKEAAWLFLQFMTGEFAQEEMAKCGQIPVNKATMETETVKNADFAPYIEALPNAKSRPTVAAWTEMDNDLMVSVTAVMNGEKSAQDAMDELALKWDALLAQ